MKNATDNRGLYRQPASLFTTHKLVSSAITQENFRKSVRGGRLQPPLRLRQTIYVSHNHLEEPNMSSDVNRSIIGAVIDVEFPNVTAAEVV